MLFGLALSLVAQVKTGGTPPPQAPVRADSTVMKADAGSLVSNEG